MSGSRQLVFIIPPKKLGTKWSEREKYKKDLGVNWRAAFVRRNVEIFKIKSHLQVIKPGLVEKYWANKFNHPKDEFTDGNKDSWYESDSSVD